MIVKTILDENFSNYKKPSMLIAMPRCTMKCGEELCQNSPWLHTSDVEIDDYEIIKRYLNNHLTKAIVFSGLDPMDTSIQLLMFIDKFRKYCDDDVVIYTGYNKEEILNKIEPLLEYPNIIVKFGRYIPNQKPHFEELLGVNLASDNQYAEKIS